MEASFIMSKDEPVPPKFISFASPEISSNKSSDSIISNMGSHDSLSNRRTPSLDHATIPPSVQRQSSMQTVFMGEVSLQSAPAPETGSSNVGGMCCCCKGLFY